MMTAYRHIIWDWNGTLLDDVWLCIEIMNRLLAERGLYGLNHSRYRDIFDFPVEKYYEKAGLDLHAESFDSLCGEFCEAYEQRVGECELHQHALEVLDYCTRKRVTQSILSSTEQGRLEKVVRMSGLDCYFENLIGQADYFAEGKVESGKKLIARLDFNHEEILLIGDTIHDEITAREMGIGCALVSIGHHPAEKLNKTGVSVFDNLHEIVHLLKDGHGT